MASATVNPGDTHRDTELQLELRLLDQFAQ